MVEVYWGVRSPTAESLSFAYYSREECQSFDNIPASNNS